MCRRKIDKEIKMKERDLHLSKYTHFNILNDTSQEIVYGVNQSVHADLKSQKDRI